MRKSRSVQWRNRASRGHVVQDHDPDELYEELFAEEITALYDDVVSSDMDFCLSDWEQGFIASVGDQLIENEGREKPLSGKQLAILKRIHDKVTG